MPDLSDAPSLWRRSPRVVFAVWLLVTAPTVAFYWWTATSSNGPPIFSLKHGDHYNLLVDGYLKGHLYLAVQPPPALLALPNPYDPVQNLGLRLHDASLYRGRYYLYFGPVPALFLHLPWRAVSQAGPPAAVAVLYYVFIGYVFSSLLLLRLLEAARIRIPLALLALLFAALGLAQFTPILLRRPMVYEIAIASGFCFLMAGLYFVARSVLSKTGLPAATIGAGICLGLAPGCRPHLAVTVAVLAAGYVAFLWAGRRLRARALWAEIGRFLAPIAICGLLLAWYNYARFGNPLEFGINHQLTASTDTVGFRSSLGHIIPELKVLLFFEPAKITGFPYYRMRYFKAAGATFAERTLGVTELMPLCVLGCMLAPFVIGRKRWMDPQVSWALAALFTSAVPTLFVVCLSGDANLRYQVDYTPALWVGGLVVSLVIARGMESVWMRRSLTALVVVLCVYGLAAAPLISVCGYDNALPEQNPALFHAIAEWFPASAQTALLILCCAIAMPLLIIFVELTNPFRLRVMARAKGLPMRAAHRLQRWNLAARLLLKRLVLAPLFGLARRLDQASFPLRSSLLSSWRVFAIWLLVTASAAAFYWSIGTSHGTPVWRQQQHDHYNSLADGFLSGHLYMAEQPSPQLLALLNPYDPGANRDLRKHDASLHKDRYYLSFGPVPALVLHVPWRLFSRFGPPPVFAVLFFAILGYAFSCLLLLRMLHAIRIELPLPLLAVVFAALALAQFTPLLFRRTEVYEIEIAAGFCFLIGALYFMALCIFNKAGSPACTLLAGVFLGLSPGCRPHVSLALMALAVFYFAFLIVHRKPRGAAIAAEMARLLAPIAICGGLLLWYNYARFGDAMEFGQKYQLSAPVDIHSQELTIESSVRNWQVLWFFAPKRIDTFPFFQMDAASPDEPMVGVTELMPLCVLGCLAAPFVLGRKRWIGPRASWVVAALFVAAVPAMLFLCSTGSVNLRNQVNYTPELWIAALLLALLIAHGVASARMRRALIGVIVVLCLYSAVAAAMFSIYG